MNKLYTPTLFFLVLPYLGLPYIFPSDIQPLAILFCLPFARIPQGNARFIFVILSLFSFLSFILGILYTFTSSNPYLLIDFFRDLFPFFAPPIYFSAGVFLLGDSVVSIILLRSVVKWFLFVYFLGLIFNVIGLTPIINFFRTAVYFYFIWCAWFYKLLS